VNFLFYVTLFSLNLHFFLLLIRKKRLPAWMLALLYLPMLALCALAIDDHRKFADFVFREGSGG
jgi:branched-subunit amino acid transport protein